MAAPQTPQAGPNGARPTGTRRPRAWLARRMAAVLSLVAMLGLGGVMYWNDQQGTASATQAATNPAASQPTTSVNRSDRESGDDEGEHESDDEGEGEHEGDDEGGSVIDDITNLIPGLSGNSSSSGTSTSGTSQQQTLPAPHTNTRGS